MTTFDKNIIVCKYVFVVFWWKLFCKIDRPQKCALLRKACKSTYIGWFKSLTTLVLLLSMYAYIYERLML